MAFIAGYRQRFGVERICRVLTGHGCQLCPSGYYAHRNRAASARSVRDGEVLAQIVRVHADPNLGRGVYGVRRLWHQLQRDGGVAGVSVPRCQVERLMRSAGLQGAGAASSSAPPGRLRPRPVRRTW